MTFKIILVRKKTTHRGYKKIGREGEQVRDRKGDIFHVDLVV